MVLVICICICKDLKVDWYRHAQVLEYGVTFATVPAQMRGATAANCSESCPYSSIDVRSYSSQLIKVLPCEQFEDLPIFR